jgi:ATP-dependent DNA helicase RecQ
MPEGELRPGQPVDFREVRAQAQLRFGVRRFRPGQRELISAALVGRNALGVLPTGSGKSLCYQLPSLFLKGAVVVVSPLIALMQDQHEKLREAQVETARLDSTVKPGDQREVEEELEEGAHDIVLVTPERLASEEHLEPLRKRGVDLFVVDEAHCVSQWGHDFRPAYLGLRQAIEALGRPTVQALTATATPEVARDILEVLGIPDAEIIQTGIERHNLTLQVMRTVNREEKERRLLELLAEAGGSAILYVATVRRVNELYD